MLSSLENGDHTDRTSLDHNNVCWTCECDYKNSSEHQNCSNCGKPRPINLSEFKKRLVEEEQLIDAKKKVCFFRVFSTIYSQTVL